MDVLKDKTYENYSYTSRYSTVPYYYHTKDEKYIYGIGTNLKKVTSYVLHKIQPSDTLDILALNYYNDPTLYWVVAMYNDINDPYIKLSDFYETVKVPTISAIEFGDER